MKVWRLNHQKWKRTNWTVSYFFSVKPSKIGDNNFDGFVINEKIPQRVNDKKPSNIDICIIFKPAKQTILKHCYCYCYLGGGLDW